MCRHAVYPTKAVSFHDERKDNDVIGFSAYAHIAQGSKNIKPDILYYSQADLCALYEHEVQRLYKNKGNKHSWRGLEHVQHQQELHASSASFVQTVMTWIQTNKNNNTPQHQEPELLRRYCRSHSHAARKAAALRGLSDQAAADIHHAATTPASSSQSVLERSMKREKLQRQQSFQSMHAAFQDSVRHLSPTRSKSSRSLSNNSDGMNGSSKSDVSDGSGGGVRRMPKRQNSLRSINAVLTQSFRQLCRSSSNGDLMSASNSELSTGSLRVKPTRFVKSKIPKRSRTYDAATMKRQVFSDILADDGQEVMNQPVSLRRSRTCEESPNRSSTLPKPAFGRIRRSKSADLDSDNSGPKLDNSSPKLLKQRSARLLMKRSKSTDLDNVPSTPKQRSSRQLMRRTKSKDLDNAPLKQRSSRHHLKRSKSTKTLTKQQSSRMLQRSKSSNLDNRAPTPPKQPSVRRLLEQQRPRDPRQLSPVRQHMKLNIGNMQPQQQRNRKSTTTSVQSLSSLVASGMTVTVG